jgi:hypothetical protein
MVVINKAALVDQEVAVKADLLLALLSVGRQVVEVYRVLQIQDQAEAEVRYRKLHLARESGIIGREGQVVLVL